MASGFLSGCQESCQQLSEAAQVAGPHRDPQRPGLGVLREPVGQRGCVNHGCAQRACMEGTIWPPPACKAALHLSFFALQDVMNFTGYLHTGSTYKGSASGSSSRRYRHGHWMQQTSAAQCGQSARVLTFLSCQPFRSRTSARSVVQQ